MTNKTIALALLVCCAALPGFAAAENGAQADAKIEEFNAKISRTAEALGISVYEDVPVQASAAYTEAGEAPREVRSSQTRLAAAVPEPTPERVSVPQAFSGPEPVYYSGTAVTIWHALGTQIADLGWIPGTQAPPSFEAISERVTKASKSTAFPARPAGQPSLFTEAGFVSEYEKATGASFTSGNYTRFLIDGEESFQVKDSLIKNAKKSLLISSWAFYDDTTGYEAAQMLIAKQKEGVNVQIMVDNMVTSSHGKKIVKMMKDAGIEILPYTDSDRSGDIWHVKIMIADDQYAVAGGMNFGDVYSHKAGSIKWRDTDVMFSGPAVQDAKKLVGDLWNAKIAEKKLPYKTVDVSGAKGFSSGSGSARVSVVLENPPNSSPVLISIIKAMYGATRNINIENAYFVAIPAVTQAVLEARGRGVEVNILTNSKESIDAEGKSLVDAMAKCMIPLVQAGVNVYLKQGVLQTLHSKFMTVDGEFADIGSYNLHPRSERLDTELNVNVLDRASVAQLDEAFRRDIAAAKKTNSAADFGEKPGFVSHIMSTYFYAQLEASPEGALLAPGK